MHKGTSIGYCKKPFFNELKPSPPYFEDDLSIPFNSNIFKDILSSNKDMDGGVLKLTQEGYINLKFTSEGLGITSEYFLVRNEQ